MHSVKNKILLFLAAVCICFHYWDNVFDDHFFTGTQANIDLCWQGAHLCICPETQCKMLRDDRILPAHYRPLFFQKIPINRASGELLQTVHGLGPSTAEKILELKRKKGHITNLEELLEVRGIGPKKLVDFRKYLVVEPL